jgi:hypothetical protein
MTPGEAAVMNASVGSTPSSAAFNIAMSRCTASCPT